MRIVAPPTEDTGLADAAALLCCAPRRRSSVTGAGGGRAPEIRTADLFADQYGYGG